MRRLTILLAAVGALLLVPAAQAFANGTLTVEIAGSGSGKVSSVKGVATYFEEAPEIFIGLFEGTPPIKCSGPPASGTCANELESSEIIEEFNATALLATSNHGSELSSWTVEGSTFHEGTHLFGGCLEHIEEATSPEFFPRCFVAEDPESEDSVVVTATFVPCSEGSEAASCQGPTNRRSLTVTKSAGGTGGIGSVSSKPKGINCGAACNSAVASMYKETPVTLTAKPSTGSTFTKWSNPGGVCDESTSTACTVPMSEDESVEAVFGGTSKAILNPQALTLNKGESSGYGTVKASGLACEAECTETTVLYQGPTGVAPKNKPGKTVELKALAAWGSTFTGWSGAGCSGTGVCKVTMEEAATVTATFTAKPTATLTLNKAGTGSGSVSSKPKAISCGTACTTASATVPTGESIVLTAKPATGPFEGWTGACEGSGETCTVSLTEAGTVTAKFGGTAKAILNAKALTLTKAGSGYGTVKAAGLTCEVLCTSTVALYQGPTGIAPKNKPGKTVILKAVSAPGSKTVAWSGCLSNPTPTECSVTMEAAVEVTATFDEIE